MRPDGQRRRAGGRSKRSRSANDDLNCAISSGGRTAGHAPGGSLDPTKQADPPKAISSNLWPISCPSAGKRFRVPQGAGRHVPADRTTCAVAGNGIRSARLDQGDERLMRRALTAVLAALIVFWLV